MTRLGIFGLIALVCIVALAACGGTAVRQLPLAADAGMQNRIAVITQADVPDGGRKPVFKVHRIPSKSGGFTFAGPGWLAVDSKDNAWTMCWLNCGGLIGEMTLEGRFTAYTPYWKDSGEKNLFESLLKYSDEPAFTMIGPDDELWFMDVTPKETNNTHVESAVGRMDITQPFANQKSFEGWKVPSLGEVGPMAVADGKVWFFGGCTSPGGFAGCKYIYSVTMDGDFKRYDIPDRGSQEAVGISMVAGKHGAIWFNWAPLSSNVSYMDELLPSGGIKHFVLPSGTNAVSPTLGPDGAIWYLALGRYCRSSINPVYESGEIGRIDEKGHVKEFCLKLDGKEYGMGSGMTTGPDGAVWFLSQSNEKPYLGRIAMNGRMSEYRMSSEVLIPSQLEAGKKHDLWMTDRGGNNVVNIRI